MTSETKIISREWFKIPNQDSEEAERLSESMRKHLFPVMVFLPGNEQVVDLAITPCVPVLVFGSNKQMCKTWRAVVNLSLNR